MPAASSSSSSSSTSCPPRPPPRLRLFHLHFRLANLSNSSPSSSPTSQLSAHCWTSTCELPSSVCTAGPQPWTCPAQCAPLDLNRGPAALSVHRWTSTENLPSSVCTAGPQPGTCPAQCAPEELRKKVSTIAMPGAGLLLLFWGLQRGYPLWTCFLAFFNKGFIRKSAVW